MRFQQLTGPVMAKGVEDTAFYGFNRLVALNEVGGDPGGFGVAVEEFHAGCAEAQAALAATMLATSTHDTKRSEDVRARLALLSEIPERWSAAVQRWAAMNERAPARRAGPTATPSTSSTRRSWAPGPSTPSASAPTWRRPRARRRSTPRGPSPHAAYEDALRGFVDDALADAEFRARARAVRRPAGRAGPHQLARPDTRSKLTAPGVPDLYQGTELWDLTPGRPGQPPPRRLRAAPPAARRARGTTPEEIWRGSTRACRSSG